MESLCTVGSDDRLCTVRVGILSLNTPTHQGSSRASVSSQIYFFFFLFLFLPVPRYPASEPQVKGNVCVRT